MVRASLRRPGTTLLLSAAWVGIAALGLGGLRIETTTDSVLNRTGSDWRFYGESQARFGGDEVLVVALEAPRPFDPATLRRVEELTDALEALPGVRRVDSLASVPVVTGRADGSLDLSPALAGVSLEAAAAVQVRARLEGDRVAPRSLVSGGGRVLAVNVLLEEGAEAEYPAVFAGIEAALDGTPAWVSGVPVFRTEASATTQRELLFFVPLTLLLVALLLFAVFRSLRATAIPLVTSAAGALALLGVMGAAGAPLTLTTAILPSIVLALGCAYAMHLLTAASGVTDRAALAEALAPVALPIALSGLTTAIGFVAISLVRIDAIRLVGGYGALGVLAVLALTLTAAPAALALWPLGRGAPVAQAWLKNALGRGLVGFSARHGAAVLGVWALVGVGFAGGLARLEVETDATRWFPPGHSIRDAYETIRARLSGISPMNIVIQSRDGRPVTAPEVLGAIDGLTAHLGGLPEVGKALSLADPLRQLHGGFSDDASQPLPVGRALVEQYLLLLESVEQLDDLVSDDRLSANVVLRVDDNGSAHLLEVARQASDWWRTNGPAGTEARATGIMYEFGRATDEVARGQLLGLGFAAVAIAAILYAIYRSAPLAAAAMLPNAAPVLLVFGAMGWLGIPIDAGTVLVGSFALGIAVDDTVHVVSAFHAERSGSASAREALLSGVRRVLPALVYTTVIVALGFAVLIGSDFSFTRNLGVLTAAVMGACLLADLTLLPPLLLRLEHSSLPATTSACGEPARA